MIPLTIAVVLVMLLCAAVLGGFAYLAKHPPVIHVDLGDVRIDVVGTLDATQAIPSTLNLRVQSILPAPADDSTPISPMPLDVLAYIDQESDEWARVARRTRARALHGETGNWEHVLATLKREDGSEQPTKPEE